MRRINLLNIALAVLAITFITNLLKEGSASSLSLNHLTTSAPSAASSGLGPSTPATTPNCNHGCSWTIGGITYRVPNRSINVRPTTTVPPVTTTTVLPTTTTTVKASVAPQPVASNPYGVTQSDIVAWTRVAICEEGGNWHVRGYKYSGGLGILNYNWTYYSAGMGLPASAADATPVQQIAVAKKINAGYAVPDQYGCAAW